MSDLAPLPRKRGRPRLDPATPGHAREGLLRAGVALLTEKGFSAVGLEEMLAAAAMPKGSFYRYFPSKEAFGLALIDRYDGYFQRKLRRHLEAAERAPLDRLADFIADARDGMARHGFARGCLVGNLGQEMGVLPESFRARIIAVFAEWEALLARCLAEARLTGQLMGHDPEALAAFFWIGWEGAVLRAKLERSPAPLDAFAAGFFRLISPSV
ncbi:MAG: TetR/AcrR family transcriptional regulator [Gemmobacter sp.]|uniref:acrylate utilization transcriptional regulator AcuR n=1 Tax=Gemmobacter sp. TaxID=1898957 RepID=UPI001A5D1C05|nr:TetR/AcrR family transcriptional regulator [Gemmobacter sp.]MBL8561796.1 TetR/AcrR family transcriptional regulator [Gemmobacter sp.]